MAGKLQLLIEVDVNDYRVLKKKIKKTKAWLDDNDEKKGEGICLANDPEYQDDVYCIDAKIIVEITDPL